MRRKKEAIDTLRLHTNNMSIFYTVKWDFTEVAFGTLHVHLFLYPNKVRMAKKQQRRRKKR